MALTEALRFLITSDSAQARGDLARLGQTTTTTMSGLDKLKSAFGAGLGIGAGAGALDAGLNALGAVGRFAVSQIQDAVGAASRLQQAQGGVRAIFAESSGEIERFSRAAADAVGLSAASFQQQATTLGALLVNLGKTREEAAATAIELVKIGADRAAATGVGTTADAVNALGAALRGERDPAERFGFTLKEAQIQSKALEMGLAATAAELDDSAKATATLALIQQQASNTTGAFARESDTLAGQQQRFRAELEDARAELGEALLPAMTELVQVSRDLIPVLSFVSGQVQNIADAAGKASGPVRSLFGGIDSLVAPLRDMPVLKNILGQNDEGETARYAAAVRDLFVAVNKGEQSASALLPALAALPPTLRETVLEIAGIGPAADASALGTDGLAKSLSGLQKQAAGVADGLFGADRAQSAFFKSIASSGGGSAKNAEKALRSIEDATRNLADAQASLQETEIQRFLTSLGTSSDDITLAQIAERDSTRSLADAKRDLVDAQERLRQLREGDAANLLDAEAANIAAQRALVDAERSGDAVALKRAQADLIRTEEQLARVRDPQATGELALAEQAVAEAQDNVLRAEIDAKRSREELNEVINRGKEGSRELSEANKAVEREQRRVEQAERALVDAQDALNTSTSGLGGTVKTANDRFLEGVSAADGWLKKLIDGKATPEEFAGAVDTIRANLKGVADEAGKTQALDEYLGKIQAIYDKINDLSGVAGSVSGKLSGLVGQSTSIGAGTSGTSTVNLNIDGKRFGQVVVDSLIQWANDNGAIPVRTR